MSKKQNLLKLSITIMLILALAAGLFLSADIINRINGGNGIVEGGDLSDYDYEPFGSMPDNVNSFTQFNQTNIDNSANVKLSDFTQSGEYYIVDSANKLAYVITRHTGAAKFRLANDFIITDPSVLVSGTERRLSENVTLDGNGHTIVVDYKSQLTQITENIKSYFGGFLDIIKPGAVLTNLNYYLAPNASVMVMHQRTDISTNVGGFVGEHKGTISNCNINIYGNVYALRMGRTEEQRPRAGGVFAWCEGKVDNTVMNVIGAEITGMSHEIKGSWPNYGDPYRSIGGIAGVLRVNGNSKFNNVVMNISPSTLIGADLMGQNSNEPSASYNEVGLIGGNCDSCDFGAGYSNVRIVNYNDFYNYSSSGVGTARFRVPNAYGYLNTGVNNANVKFVNLRGGSINGEDVDIVANSDGNITIKADNSALSYNSFNGGDSFPDAYNLTTYPENIEFEFFKGMASGDYVINSAYDWNRFVGLSGSAYYNDDGVNDNIRPVDKLSTIKTQGITKERLQQLVTGNVVFNTKDNGGRLVFDDSMAIAYGLYAKLSGNNGTNPEDNVVVFPEISRKMGVIHIFGGQFNNLKIEVSNKISNNGIVYWYTGGFIDYMKEGSSVNNSVIETTGTGLIVNKSNSNDKAVVSESNVSGETHYGGFIGRMEGRITNSEIRLATEVTIGEYLRFNSNTNVGGFAAYSESGIAIENSIINVRTKFATQLMERYGSFAGLIAQVNNSVSITNSKISVQITGASVSATNASYFGGLTANIKGGNYTVTNSALDYQIAGVDMTNKQQVNTSYSIGNNGGNVSFNNVAINMNETYGMDASPLFNNAGNGVNLNNVWVYNAGRIKSEAGFNSGNANAISAIGSTVAGGSGRVVLVDILNKKPGELSSVMPAACANFKFYAQPYGSFYDGKITERGKDGYTITVGGGDIAAQELGWFNGNLGDTANYVGGDIAKDASVTYYKDSSNNTEYYIYSLTVNNNLANQNVKALFSTKYISNAAQWNQFARNVNAGLSRTWLNAELTDDIVAGTLLSIGGSEANSFKGQFDGKNFSVTFDNVVGASGSSITGLFGVINNGAVVKNLNLYGGNVALQARIDDETDAAPDQYFGIVSGLNKGTIENINLYPDSSIKLDLKAVKNVYFGLIAGYNSGSIKNVNVDVQGTNAININDTNAGGNIYIGGGVGVDKGVLLENIAINLNNLTIRREKGENLFVGGAVGLLDNTANIINSVFVSTNEKNFDTTLLNVARVYVAGFAAMNNGIAANAVGGGVWAHSNDNVKALLNQDGSVNSVHDELKTIVVNGTENLKKSTTISVKYNSESNNFTVSVTDNGTFAVASFNGKERNSDGTITGSDSSYTLSRDTSYNVKVPESIETVKDSDWKITINIISNEIRTQEDWNQLAHQVNNNGATFRGMTFKVMADITFTGTINEVGNAKNAFYGTIDGNGYTLTLGGGCVFAEADYTGLVGVLGEDGIVKNINVRVNDTLTSEGNIASGVLVGENRGTIGADDSEISITAVNAKKRIIGRDSTSAGIVTGINNGTVKNIVVDLNVGNISDTQGAQANITIKGENVGVIAGINKSAIDTIKLRTMSVKLEGKNAGFMVGKMEGDNASLNSAINELGAALETSNSPIYYDSARYFVGDIGSSKDRILNTWIYNRTASTLSESKYSSSSLEDNKAIFNAMYLFNLTDQDAGMNISTSNGNVMFTRNDDSINTPFYGFVENFESATIVEDNDKLSVEGNIQGKTYAMVFANRFINSLDELKALNNLDNKIALSGLEFQLMTDITLTTEHYNSWTPIDSFKHKLNGSGHTITSDLAGGIKAENALKPMFNNIESSGGVSNLNFEIVANYISSGDYAGLIANTNAGLIDTISVSFVGKISAAQGAGIIVGKNTGSIIASNVVFESNTYNGEMPSEIVSDNYAGGIAGVNEGIISQNSVYISDNSSIGNATYAGGIVGHNTSTGIIEGRFNEEVAVSLLGDMTSMVGMGGIAALNEGIISNITINVDNVSLQATETSFAGAVYNNEGYIGKITVNFNADTSIANFSNVAGLAVMSSGFITTATVNVNNNLVANDVASAFIVNGTDSKNEIGGITINSGIFAANVTINGKVSAKNAVGFVYSNSAVLNNIYLVNKGSIVSNDDTDGFASVFGHDTDVTNDVRIKYISYNDENRTISESVEVGSSNIVIFSMTRPEATDAVGVFKEYPVDVNIPNAWFIKNNTYSVVLGNSEFGTLGFNEFKGVTSNDIKIAWEGEQGNQQLVVTTNGSESVVTTGMNEGELTTKQLGSIYSHEFRPGKDGLNRTVVFSLYKLTINSDEDFMEVNGNISNYDLFYDIDINLNIDIEISTDAKFNGFQPFGNLHAFNANFVGNGHEITLSRSLAGNNSGLFGTIGKSGGVSDLIVNIGNNVNIGTGSSVYSGGLAGEINGTINNVAVKFDNSETPEDLASIIAEKMYGGFAGRIDSAASINDSWLFMQNKKYPIANGVVSSTSSSAGTKTEVNTVNLGGVADVDIRFKDGKIAIYIDKDTISADTPWRDEFNNDVESQLIKDESSEGFIGYVMPTGEDAKDLIYNVSLIVKSIGNLEQLVNLADNIQGFQINSSEEFLLTSDIEITKEGLEALGRMDGFFAIGSSKNQFTAKFNGQGHTITFAAGVKVTGVDRELAGLFGSIAPDAQVRNLKVAVNTNDFDATMYAGGLAGVNEGSISNVVVEYLAEKPVNTSLKFGGLIGYNEAKTSSNVFFVRDYKRNEEDMINPLSSGKDQSVFNIVTIYRSNDEQITSSVSADGTVTFVADSNGGAPFYGGVNTLTGVRVSEEGSNEIVLRNDVAVSGQQFAVLFVNNKIANMEDMTRVAEAVNNGYNVKGLEYVLTDNIVINSGAEYVAMSDTINNAFRSTFNGNGKTVTLVSGSIVGENAGFIGYASADATIKNLVIDVKSEFVIGKTGSGENVTSFAGIVAGRNFGTVENVAVIYNGNQINGGGEDVMFGNNSTQNISGTWLICNNSDSEINVANNVNVLRMIGVTTSIESVVNNADGLVIKPVGGVYVYVNDKMDEYLNDNNGIVNTVSIAAGIKGESYVMSDFDLVISNVDEFTAVSKAVNEATISLKGIRISIDKDIAGLDIESPAEGIREFSPIGADANKPFESIFDGNGKRIIVRANNVFKGTDYAGIFGYVGAEGEIVNIEIYMYGSVEVNAGTVSGSDGNQSDSPEIYAGIIGRNDGYVSNSVFVWSANAKMITPESYTGKEYVAGAIGYTVNTNNVWYIDSTTNFMKASAVSSKQSLINNLVMVGELVRIDTAIDVEKNEVVFKTVDNKGGFFDDFANSVEDMGKSELRVSGATGEQKEFVYLDYKLQNADDWKQLAIDTKAGYPFTGRTFTIPKGTTLNIKALNENSLGVFGGTIISEDTAADVYDIIVNNADGAKDFTLIDTLTANAKIDGLNIKIGTNENRANIDYSIITDGARGLIVNTNNGAITGIKADIAVNYVNSAFNTSTFVGNNNGTISDLTLNVTGNIKATGRFGFAAIYNNGTLENVDLTADNARVALSGNNSYAGMLVAENGVDKTITDININVKEGSYLQGNSTSSNVAGLAGRNKGVISNGTVTFGDPCGSAYLSGYRAAFFVADNDYRINNMIVMANGEKSDGDVSYINAYMGNNAYDYNGGLDGENNFIIIDDSDNNTINRKMNVKVSNIIVVEGYGDIKVTKDGSNIFTFTAEERIADGKVVNDFNGWYQNNKRINGDNKAFTTGTTVKNKQIYDVVFLNTNIASEADWNALAQLVNGGKDVNSVVFKLSADIELNENIVPIGTKEHPFGGKIYGGYEEDGKIKNHTVTINKGLEGVASAALFGYIKGATIANINVTVSAGAKINGSEYAGALVGYAENSTVSSGTFNSSNEFEEQEENGTLLNEITILGEVGNAKYTGGAIGYIVGGTLKYTIVYNNGKISADSSLVSSTTSVGGLLGYNEGGELYTVTVNNEGLIEGYTTGGLVGQHVSSSTLDRVSVISVSENAIIDGVQSGALAGYASAGIDSAFVKFANNRHSNTVYALAQFASDIVITDTWVITNSDVRISNFTGESESRSVKVMRSDDVNNIDYDIAETDNTVFRVILNGNENATGKYIYWKYTNGNSLYDGGVNSNILGNNGIVRSDNIKSFDITLELKDTVETLDHFYALQEFAKNTYANGEYVHFNGDTVINVTDDIIVENINIDMFGGYKLNVNDHILTVDNTVIFRNGVIENGIIVADGENVVISDGTLTLSGVTLVDSVVYRNDNIPAADGRHDQFTTESGKFSISAKDGGNNYLVSRDINVAVIPGYTVKYIIGNIPLYADGSEIGVDGYTDDASYAYKFVESGDRKYYYAPTVDNNNKMRLYAEMNFLMNKGFDFTGTVIDFASDVEIPANSMLGSGDAVFNGTLNGQGYTLTFNDDYKPLFNKIGANGVIMNFVVNVKGKKDVPVFQGTKPGEAVSGTMSNIVIVNSGEQYTEASIDYNDVLLVQKASEELTTYTRMHALWLGDDSNVNVIVSRDNGIEFSIESDIVGDSAVMFNGFREGSDSSSPLVSGSVLNVSALDGEESSLPYAIYVSVISNVITDVDSWNVIAKNTNDIMTKNSSIVINSDLELNIGITAMGDEQGMEQAVVEGNNHKIVLGAGEHQETFALFDNYNGLIKNLIIDATATGLSAENIIKSADMTTFENVVVITKNSPSVTKAGADRYTSIIIGESVVQDVSDSAYKFVYKKDNGYLIHMTKDGITYLPASDDVYGVIDLSRMESEVVDPATYTVDFITEITSQEHIKSLAYAPKGINELKLANDIVISESIAFAKNSIDANGQVITVEEGYAFDINDGSIKNAQFNGAGSVNVAGGTLSNSVVLSAFGYTSGSIDNVWYNAVQDITNDGGANRIDMSEALLNGAYEISFADAVFTLKLKDILNGNNEDKYYIGTTNDSGASYNIASEYVFGAAQDKESAVNGMKVDYLDALISGSDMLSAFTDAMNTVNKSKNLNAKTFYLGADVDFSHDSENKVPELNDADGIVIDGQDHIVRLDEFRSDVFGYYTLNNLIFEFHHRTSGELLANIGNDVTIITYDSEYVLADSDSSTNVIRINHYGAHSNTYTNNNGIITLNTQGDFIARSVKFSESGAISEIGDVVTEIDLGKLTGNMDILFFLPVNVSLKNIPDSSILEGIIGTGFSGEIPYLAKGDDMSSTAKGEYTLTLNLTDNVVLNGYTINGKESDVNTYNNEVKFTYESSKTDIVLDVAKFGYGNNVVNTVYGDYSLDGSDKHIIENVTEVAPRFTLKDYLTFKVYMLGEDGSEIEANPVNAGTYSMRMKFTTSEGAVVGQFDFTEIIRPYAIAGSDLAISTREYMRDENGVGILTATIDESSPLFAKVSEEIKNNIIASLKLEYISPNAGNNIQVKFTGFNDGAELNSNFTVKNTARFTGTILPAEVTVKIDDVFTYEFSPIFSGNNILKDVDINAILEKMSEEERKGLTADDIRSATSGLPFFYVNNEGMLNVGEYGVVANIAAKNYNITADTSQSKVVINKAKIKISIEDNSVYKKNYLGRVADGAEFFKTTVTDISDSLLSMTATLDYPIIGRMVEEFNVGGVVKRFITMGAGEYDIDYNSESIVVKYGSEIIDSSNYSVEEITAGKFTINKTPVRSGLTINSSSKYNGSTPELKGTIRLSGYQDAGLTVDARFVVADVKDAGTYDVEIRVMSGLLGGVDVTEYMDINETDKITYNAEKKCYMMKYTIDKLDASIYLLGQTMTYGDDLMAINNGFYSFVNTGLKDTVLDIKFRDSEGNIHDGNDSSIMLNAGEYEVVYIPEEDTAIYKNFNITIKNAATKNILKVNKKNIKAEMSIKDGLNNITYGDKFAGFDMKITDTDGAEWTYANATFEYLNSNGEATTLEEINAGFFGAGAHTVKVRITYDTANHNLADNDIAIEVLNVAPKAINVSFRSGGSVRKSYSQDKGIDTKLDGLLEVPEGQLVGNDKASDLQGIYTWKEKIGSQDVILTGIKNPNYVLANTGDVVGKGALIINKLNYDVTVDEITINEKKNITTIVISMTYGSRYDGAEISLDGRISDKKAIEEAINKYLAEEKNVTDENYNVSIENNAKVKVQEFDMTMVYVFYGIAAGCLLLAIIMLLSSVILLGTMPSAAKRDFDFQQDKNTRDVMNLLKRISRSKKKEYKITSKEMKKAMKKSCDYDIENSLFPEIGESESGIEFESDNSSAEEAQDNE